MELFVGKEKPFINVDSAYTEQVLTSDKIHDLRKNTFNTFSLLTILVVALALSAVFQLLSSNLFHQQQTLFGGLAWLAGQALLLFGFKRGLSKTIVVNLSMLLSGAILNATIWTSTGILAIETPLLMLIPLIVLSVQGHKAGLVWFSLALLNILALSLAPKWGISFDKPAHVESRFIASGVFLIVMMSCAFGLIRILQRENKKLQAELAKQVSYHSFHASHDGLTQLLNKESFKNIFERKIARAKHENESMTLLVIDLNKFKQVNDKYGHLVGDQVLKGVAQNLSLALRPTDIAGRIGGDEFAILLDNAVKDTNIEPRICALRTAIKQTINTRAGDISIEAAIGSSIFSRDGDSFEALYEAADRSMYERKRESGTRIID